MFYLFWHEIRKNHTAKKRRDFWFRARMDIIFVRYIKGETCEKRVLFLTVLPVNIICDDDTAKTMRWYLMCQKQPGKGVLTCEEAAG